MSGRGAWAARHLLDHLRGLLGSAALEEADRRASAGGILAWAGVHGIGGRSEVCERTAGAALRLVARVLPGVVTFQRGIASIRLRHFTRFAAGLAEVASITPEILAAAWSKARLADEPAESAATDQGTLSGAPYRSTHAGKPEQYGAADPSDEASTESTPAACGLGCASPAPAEEAGARPAVSPARAADALLFFDGATPCQPEGARARPSDRILPTCSRWMFQAPPVARDLIAGGLQGGLRPGQVEIGAVAGRQPFLELARELLSREALRAAQASDDGVVEQASETTVRGVASELRRLARAGRLDRRGGRWLIELGANPVLELEQIESAGEARLASRKMRARLEQLGVPIEWAREMGHEEARRLHFALGFKVDTLRCPKLEVRGERYSWRRTVVRPRRAAPQMGVRSKIRALGHTWSKFEQACRAGSAPAPDVALAVAVTSYTGRPTLAL